MKLFSPLILSLVLVGSSSSTVAVSATRLRRAGATARATPTTAATATTTGRHRHLKEEGTTTTATAGGAEVEDTGTGQCGQCKKADDCRSGYDCVSATASGCFNFDASADKNLYCVPGPTAAPAAAAVITDAPTVAAGTDAPTDGITDAPTAAGTDAPTADGTGAPTDAFDGDAIASPTDPQEVFCTTDVFECGDNVYVSRDSKNGCAFPSCPSKDSAAEKDTDPGGTGQCGQCKKADDCRSGYDCVSATEALLFNCYNFDAAADKNLYCVPGATAAPTVAGTDAPTVAGTTTTSSSAVPTTTDGTSGPTDVVEDVVEDVQEVGAATTTSPSPTVVVPVATPAPSEAATSTSAPTVGATSTAVPTAAATATVGPTAAATTAVPTVDATGTPVPTPPPTYAKIRYIGDDPDIAMRMCEGDCDDDDDCEGDLVCMQRSDDEPIPGCGGTARDEKDYCIQPPVSAAVIAAAQAAPSSPAGMTTTVVGAAVVGAASAVVLGMFYLIQWRVLEFKDPIRIDLCQIGGTICQTIDIRYIDDDPTITLRVCEGDCDNDNDCEGDLVCMQRSDDEPVPGCGGTARDEKDYCIQPP
eukprot:CAMPEP_0181044952 /NCGR_PEP_ID=MMETSP1070-20121207/13543_1 /TAXON_ID=265543 /ORGANISM="Minutocellus polymorphus, Strain NH13" /LENGTH=586 /DNA_ID=CAMNT_0023123437 /DNA_START=73 /DNA_END=1835 /DNA_ORIENTATION=+